MPVDSNPEQGSNDPELIEQILVAAFAPEDERDPKQIISELRDPMSAARTRMEEIIRIARKKINIRRIPALEEETEIKERE